MGLFGPSRKELQRVQQELAAARTEAQQLADRLAQAEAQRDALAKERYEESQRRSDAEGERDALYEERDVLRIERDVAAEERDGLRAEREALIEERDGLRAERDAARADAEELRRQLAADSAVVGAGGPGEAFGGRAAMSEPGGRGGRAANGSWSLVLADLERRWAAGTGAVPAMRGVTDGPVSAQLAEGLTREVERLREEMGVDVSLITGEPIEPSDPVVFLLAATDLLGALAATCERVTVTLDGTLVLTGEVWVELGDDLDVSRNRAISAGALIDPIAVDDDQVRITLRP